MGKRLKVQLMDGWSDYSNDNPEGPPTYLRDISEVPGPLQVSFIEFIGGIAPDATNKDLVQIAKDTGNERDFGEITGCQDGDCVVGKYGTVIFKSEEFSRIQVWYLSNGKDFVFVTHICPEKPDIVEVDEVQKIVQNIELVDEQWWKFW